MNPDRQIVIDLEELVDVMEWRSEGLDNFLDLQTGAIVLYHQDLGDWEEGDPPEPAWQREQRAMNRSIEDAPDGRYVRIEATSSEEAHRWMVGFAESVPDRGLTERLQASLRGRGAFRRFRETLPAPSLDAWHRYQRERLEEAARDWLDSLKISYRLKGPPEPGR